MKKVAIVSCYFQRNYGSMLQSFATQKIINKLGYEYETIRIDGIYKELQKAKIKHYLLQLNNFNVVKGKLGYIKKSIVKRANKEVTMQMAIRDEKFIEFKNTKFKLSRICKGRQELTDYCKDFSSVLVGSDQLWLPSNIDADYYTLSFVPDCVNKVSYATSFGVSDIPERQWKIANQFLNRINHVSVREQTGRQIVKKVAQRDVPVVCDPTLLFTGEQWAGDFPDKRPINEKYILCYFLGNNPEQRDFVRRMREVTGLKIVSLLHLDEYIKSDCDFPDYAPFDVGPGDFVHLVRNAEYVCTDSFHGSVFSILNKKKFFTFRRFKEGSTLSTNSRIHSLLNLLGLEERFINGHDDVNECLAREIEYSKVLNKVETFRKASLSYLTKALEDGE